MTSKVKVVFGVAALAAALSAGVVYFGNTSGRSDVVRGPGESAEPGSAQKAVAQPRTRDPLAAFVGRWTYKSGTQVSECEGAGTPETRAMDGQSLDVVSDGAGNLVASSASCTMKLVMEAGVAKLSSPHTCGVSNEKASVKFTFQEFTLNDAGNGQLRMQAASDLVVEARGSAQPPRSCHASANGVLNKA